MPFREIIAFRSKNNTKQTVYVRINVIAPLITVELDSSRWTGPRLPRITEKLGLQELRQFITYD